MSLKRRDQLVEQIVQGQPKFGVFLQNLHNEHDLMEGSWDFLAYSFQKGFETLWDHAVNDNAGLLLQPLLMLWRQSVELALKSAIIYIAKEIHGKPGHNLDELFLQLIRVRADLGFSDDDDLTENVREMISLVQSLDTFADRFRYPATRNGEPFPGIAADFDRLFQSHWIIVTYCEGCAVEVEEVRGRN